MSEKEIKDGINTNKKGAYGFALTRQQGKEERAIPDYVETENGDGLVYYGEEHEMPEFYHNLYQNGSGKHQAIINRKTKMIAGQGFEDIAEPQLVEFVKNSRGKTSLKKVVRRFAKDYEIHNRATLLIRWNLDKTKIAAIDYTPVMKYALDEDGVHIWYSQDWTGDSRNKKKSEKRKMQLFNKEPLPSDFNQLEDEDKKIYLNQIYHLNEPEGGCDYYAEPEYKSELESILADAEIGRYSYNLIRKKFTAEYHVDFRTGVPEEDERKQIKKDFLKEYTGTEPDTETIIVTFSEPEGEATKINPLPAVGNEQMYIETNKMMQDRIFIAHQVNNPNLFGIAVPGELGGRQKMQEDLEVFQSIYVDQKQEIIEDVFNELASVNGIPTGLSLAKYSLVDIPIEQQDAGVLEALNSLSPLVANKVLENMSEEEVRGLIGLSGNKVVKEESNIQTIEEGAGNE